MKKIVVPILVTCIFFSPYASGQKKEKLIPASRSELTGISLPAGTLQDKRFMSLVSVKTFIEQETKQAGVGVKVPEVFRLTPAGNSKFGADSLVKRLWGKGWSIVPMKSDVKFAWLKKGDHFVMSYFSIDKKETLLYFAEADSIPTTAGTAGTIAVPPGSKDASKPNEGGRTSSQGSEKPAANPSPIVPLVPSTTSTGENSNGNKTTKPGNFTYHTTQFEDGWTSTIAEDKVIVAKGSLRVIIYQPVAFTEEAKNADNRDWAWQQIVSRDFTIKSKQYRDNGRSSDVMKAPYVEGQAIEKSSGRNVFIAMYALAASNQVVATVAVAPDEQTIRNAFPRAGEQFDSDLHAMRGYNRFSVDARDLPGTWVGNSGAGMSAFDASTGNLLGMSAAEVSDKFVFANNNTYTSRHNGGTGQVGGSQKFQQEYKGNYTADKWSMSMSNRFDGKTDQYNCYFEVVRGGRILHIQHKQYTGTWYHLVRTN